MKKLINKFYDVREGEWLVTAAMFSINFLLMVILYLLKPARDSLFLVELGAAQLPVVFMLVAVFTIPATQLVSMLVRSYNNFRVFLWTNLFVILNLIIIRALFWVDHGWVYTLFYIWVSVYSILIISQFWVFANELYNTTQSKRLFSLLNLGAILGAISGSQFSSYAVTTLQIQTENLLFICIAVILAVITIIYSLKGKSRYESSEKTKIKFSEVFKNKEVVNSVFGSKYQLIIAGIIGIAMLVSTLVDYQLKAIAADAFPQKSDLTSFMGMFYAGLSVASLLIQVIFSGRILRRMGVGGAILTRPAGMFIGSLLMMFEPVLAVAVFLGGFDGASQYSIDKTSREILFLPLSQKMKERVKFYLDVFVDRFFRGVAGFILLLLVTFLDATVQQIAWLVTGAIIGWIYLSWLAKKEYVNQFRESLNKRYFEIDSNRVDLEEAKTSEMICSALSSGDDRKIHYMLNLIDGHNPKPYIDELRNLLHHKSTKIRLHALQLLKQVPGKNFSEDIKTLLKEKDTEIRLESIHYICEHAEGNPEEILKGYLESNDAENRAAAMGCVSRFGSDEEKKMMVTEEMIESIINKRDKDKNLARAQIAQILQYHPGKKSNNYLPILINDPSPAVRSEAIKSMGKLKDPSFIPLLINKLADDSVSFAAKNALSGYGEENINLFSMYYNSGDYADEVCRILPLVIAEMNHQKAVDHMIKMLGKETKDEKRRHIIKGLNKLRSRSSDFNFHEDKIRKELQKEIHGYFKLVIIQHAIQKSGHQKLLSKAVAEKQEKIVEVIFRLMGLIYHHKDIYGAYLGLQSLSEENRSKALELLDNILDSELHRPIMSILDPSSDQNLLDTARRETSLEAENPDSAIIHVLNGNDDWLQITALYGVNANNSEPVLELLNEAAESKKPIIKETANLVLNRLN